MSLPADQFGVLQDDCVLINPRLFTQAELILAERAGATRVVDEVVELDADAGTVTTRSGDTLSADRILVAVGAYTNASGLLRDLTPGPVEASVMGCTIVLLEVEDHEDVDLPAWMYADGPYGGGLITTPRQYPDGRWYLKCAGGELIEHPLTTAEEINAWVRTGGSESEIDYFRDLVARTFPDVRVGAAQLKPCLPTVHSTGLPYIDHVAERVVLATEGERGVMTGDEIGRLAAGLLSTGHWIDPLPSHLFAARYIEG